MVIATITCTTKNTRMITNATVNRPSSACAGRHVRCASGRGRGQAEAAARARVEDAGDRGGVEVGPPESAHGAGEDGVGMRVVGREHDVVPHE